MKSPLVNQIPNALSALRIVSCLLYVFIGDSLFYFVLVTALIALTDVLDGFLARRLKCQSETGAFLDSVGDFAFFVSLLIYLAVYKGNLLWDRRWILGAAVLIKLAPLGISLARNRALIFIHTYLNKVSGLVVLAGILALIAFSSPGAIDVIACVVGVAGLEEALILILRRNPDKNLRSVLDLRKERKNET